MMKLMRNKKAQNTAEYAILIALVIGGVVAMQTYAQRALQGRIRDASIFLKSQTNELGNTLQYEPYYTNTDATSEKSGETTTTQAGRDVSSNVTKEKSVERTEYDPNNMNTEM